MSFLTTPETCHILQKVVTCTLKPNSTILLYVTYSLTSLALLRTRSMMIICPDSFWSPVLLLVMIVVSVTVIVVVVVIVVVMVIVVVVSLVFFLFPFIAFPNSCSPTLELVARTPFMGMLIAHARSQALKK
ncbi:hypothetical protein Tco_0016941 [Tanacetum coccineum]